MKRDIYLWIGLLILCTTSLFAQVPRLYSIQQGLPNSRIVNIYFDRENLLWICSEYGLMTFDGHNFMTYKADKGNPYALQDNFINCVFNDDRGNHWIGAGDGLYTFSIRENAFTRHNWRKDSAAVSVTEIRTDPQMRDALLVATSGEGVVYLDAKTGKHMEKESYTVNDLTHIGVIEHTFIDSEQRLWIVGKDAVRVLSRDRKKLLPFTGDSELVKLVLSSLTESLIEYPPLKCVLLGSKRYGILECDLKNLCLRPFENETLGKLPVTQLLADDRLRLLVGTENHGLYRYSPSAQTIEEKVAERSPIDLAHTKIHNMTFDGQGNLWLGLYRKGLVLFPQRETRFTLWKNSTYVQGGPEGYITQQCILNDGTLVTGMDGGGVSLLPPNGIDHNTIKSYSNGKQFHSGNSILQANSVMTLASDAQDNVYIGTYGYGIYYLPHNGYPSRLSELNVLNTMPIMSIITDPQKEHLYIATNGSGVYVYDILRKELSPYPYTGNGWVSCLCLTSNGHLWIGTAAGCTDVDMKTRKSREFKTYKGTYGRYFCLKEVNGNVYAGTSEGLLVNDVEKAVMNPVPCKNPVDLGDVMALTVDEDEKLWFSTTDQLYSYSITKQEINRYNASNITTAGNFNPRSVFTSPSGRLYFGGDDGVVEFSPKEIEKRTSASPGPLFITGLSVDNVRTDYQPGSDKNITDSAIWCAHTITLPYEVNSLRINFGVLNYANIMNIRYEYRILGVSENWIQIPNNQEYAILTKLHSGKYRFQVKAYVEGNPESATIREIAIVVLPPWWATWWAYIIYAALLCLVGWYIYRYYRAKFDKRQQIRMRSLYLMDLRLKLPIPVQPVKKEEPISVMLAGNAKTLTPHLKNALEDYELTQVQGAEEAFDRLLTWRPNVIVVDFNLSDCTGLEFCNRLKSDEQLKSIPLILLTNERTDELEELSIKCQVEYFIQRPVNFALLHAAIEQVYNKEQSIRRALEQVKEPGNTFEDEINRHKDINYDYTQLKIDSSDDKLMERVVDSIRKHLSDSDFSVEDLSREVGLSRVHLNRKMKDLIGSSPNALIKSIRLKQAAYLLVNNSLSISEVAYTVGFNTPSYFTTNFSAFFGMSPKEFVTRYMGNPKDEKVQKILEEQ